MWSTVRSPRHRNTLIFWFCTCSTFWKVNRSTFASLAMLIRNMWPRFLHRSAANVCLSWTCGSILKGKTLFWDQVHMLAGSMHYEAGSTYPGHLSVIGALLLWHEAGCQLQTPFKRVSMCEIDVNEELSLNRLKHRPVKSSNLQQPVIPTFIHKEIDVGNIRSPRATAGCHGRLTISGIFQKWWCYFP